MKIPENNQHVMPYLIISDAQKFIVSTTKVFGAEILMKHFRDGSEVIMHAEVKIVDSTIMFAQSTEQFSVKTGGLFVYVPNADDTFAKAIRQGAKEITPMANQAYGRSGGIEDPVGNIWWITTPINEKA